MVSETANDFWGDRFLDNPPERLSITFLNQQGVRKMSGPYIGEIRMFAGNFAPAGWAFCAGQLLPISENDALFTLIGTTYGGDGQSTFALPDLRGRIPVHQGNGYIQAQTGGSEAVTPGVA